MKKIAVITFTLILLFTVSSACFSALADSDSVVITTKAQLLDWAKNPTAAEYQDKIITLGADITLNEGSADDWAAGKNIPAEADRWTPVSGFAGTFDGKGHTISGLYVNATKEDIGFLSVALSGTVIKNLSIVNSYIASSSTRVGVFAGSCLNATFENLYSDAIVYAKASAGGVVGSLDEKPASKVTAIATSCWFDGKVTTKGRYAGGIFGHQYHNYALITDCLNTGTLHAGDSHATGISPGVYEGGLEALRCVNLGKCTQKADYQPGQAITYTIGSSDNAADRPVNLTNCFGLEGMSQLNPTDVRSGSILNGTVTALKSTNDKEALAVLDEYWCFNGEIPVPKYFANADSQPIIPTSAAPSSSAATSSSAAESSSVATSSSAAESSSAVASSAAQSSSVATSSAAQTSSAAPSSSAIATSSVAASSSNTPVSTSANTPASTAVVTSDSFSQVFVLMMICVAVAVVTVSIKRSNA